ncbi:MAG: D-amino acid dehydrogenase [Kordiimonadaceae bacterium]|jgi:D-amino-acid dehydrogenase|nr:D-amino acid dehydrogenase [Kordiimonadaceae bacterium]
MKITIIGAGIIGVTSAYFLAKAGYDVEVIDRAEGPALETSFANAGMITPSMSDPWNAPGIFTELIKSIGRPDSSFLLRPKAVPSLIGWGIKFLLNSRKKKFLSNMHHSADISCYSLNILKEMRQELNIEYEQRITGSLRIFRDQESIGEYGDFAKHLDKHNLHFTKATPEDLDEIEPSLVPIMDQLCGGIFFPDDETGNAHVFTCKLAEIAKNIGVSFRYGLSVEDLIKEKGKITKILTSDGEIDADLVVLCTGSFSPLLGKKVGINIPVRPVKGYSISVPLNGWNGGPIMPIIDDSFHAAISPIGDTVRVAGTAEFAGYDDNLDKVRIDNLYNLLEEIYPEFAATVDRSEVKEWCGFRPLSVDGKPYIGKTPIENLFVNTGHGPLGWTMSMGSAKMLSDIISGEEPALNPAPYALSRS